MTPQRKEAGKGRQPIFESRLCPKYCGRTQVTSLPGVSTSAPGKEPQRTELSAQPRTTSAAQQQRPKTAVPHIFPKASREDCARRKRKSRAPESGSGRTTFPACCAPHLTGRCPGDPLGGAGSRCLEGLSCRWPSEGLGRSLWPRLCPCRGHGPVPCVLLASVSTCVNGRR